MRSFQVKKKKSFVASCYTFIFYSTWILVIAWGLVVVFNPNILGKVAFKATQQHEHESSHVTSKLDQDLGKVNLKRENQPKPSSPEPKYENPSKDIIHIVLSTDCSPYQDWQTLLVFHSAFAVKQSGAITRIASGCAPDKQNKLKKLYKDVWSSMEYGAHFTPDYKLDEKTGKEYDFYNKPYGMKHWLEHADPPLRKNVVVVLIDPDFIFLRPVTLALAGQPNNLFFKRNTPSNVPAFLGEGVPSAQLYGLGAPWAYDRNRNFNRTRVCGPGSPCLKTKPQFGEAHYSVGPPYIVHIKDMSRIVDSWTRFVPLVYEGYPELLAEMYAYSMAAAHEELPHITMESYMVSNVGMHDEGWDWIDKLGDGVCEKPVGGVFYPGKPMPTFLHYCQFFRSAEIGFQKRRVYGDIFSCDRPLLMDLPQEQGEVRYKNRDGEIIKYGPVEARRSAFMLCTIHQSLNAALTDFKRKMCPHGADYNKTFNVVTNYRR